MLCYCLCSIRKYASARVEYLKRYKGEAVHFFCESEHRTEAPIGFYLKLKSPEPEKELMFVSPLNPAVHNPAFEGRIETRGDLREQRLNVTLKALREDDSGFYACEFIYGASPRDRSVAGRPTYFLFVEGTEVNCNCSRYSFLLYAISAATGLFFIIIIGLGFALCCKACHHERPQNPHPIYEEMSGLKPNKEKGPQGHLDLLHLEEMHSSVIDKPRCRLSQENYYVSPKRVTHTTEESCP
ncbi:cd7 antigen-like isoform X2 [Scleropages formosus]|uniref:cd7 antigen-like isoform X2 n=1 Tax=Scleropages formosus TaxID=113540 RepID=UPI0008780768|nr:uncharacterized protein LOC108940051 isoform X2 [Scleropages formosus]XP_018617384.1 uncharacterized protein LOC108940051 isoform X2 [Scleropages formosus]